MTTLPAKVGSFSGHARRNRPRFVPKAPSEPAFQNVLGGIHVPVCCVSTSGADVQSLRKRLLGLRHRVARTARLRGVPRIYRDNPHSSFFRFLCEDVEEGNPACVVRGFRKPAPGDPLDVKGFVNDKTVVVHHLPGLLVVEVPALIGCLLVKTGDASTGLATAIGAFFLSGEGALRHPESLPRLPIKARWFCGLAVRSNEEALQTEINTDFRTVAGGLGSISEIAREDNVPLAARPLDGDGFDSPFNWTMQFDLYVTDVLEVEPPVVLEGATVAVPGELDGLESTVQPEPRIPRLAPVASIARLHAPEESSKRFVQPAKRRLSRSEIQSRKARCNFASFFKAARLFTVEDTTFLGLIRIPAVAQSKVVQATMRFEHRIQTDALDAIWIKPIFKGFSHRFIILERRVRDFHRQLKQTVAVS